MSDRSYAPPSAEVRDVAHERALAERPGQVAAAIVLLWAGLVLALPIAYYEFTRASASAAVLGVLVMVFCVVLAVSGVLNVLIGRGRNWARIAYLLLTLWSLYIFFTTLNQLFAKPLLEIALNLLDTALDFAVIPLLFFGPGARWFRAMREQD